MNIPSRIATLAAVTTTTIALAAPVAFATGTGVIFDGAALKAKGAGVAATVTVTCDPYTDVWGNSMTSSPVDVTLTQAVAKGRITTATGEGTVACDSTPHTVTVLVVATTYAFTRGAALAWVTPTYDNATTPPALAGITVRVR